MSEEIEKELNAVYIKNLSVICESLEKLENSDQDMANVSAYVVRVQILSACSAVKAALGLGDYEALQFVKQSIEAIDLLNNSSNAVLLQ